MSCPADGAATSTNPAPAAFARCWSIALSCCSFSARKPRSAGVTALPSTGAQDAGSAGSSDGYPTTYSLACGARRAASRRTPASFSPAASTLRCTWSVPVAAAEV